MLSNSPQQSRQQNAADALRIGQQQRMANNVQFAQSLRETDPQRWQAMFLCGLEDQPADEQVQKHVARHFEGKALRGATLQRTRHFLPNFQFAKHRFYFPTAMIQARLQDPARFVHGGHPHPFLPGNDLRIEYVGYHAAGPKSADLIADYPQRKRLGQIGRILRQATILRLFCGVPPLHKRIVRSQQAFFLRLYAATQADAEKRMIGLDLPKQSEILLTNLIPYITPSSVNIFRVLLIKSFLRKDLCHRGLDLCQYKLSAIVH